MPAQRPRAAFEPIPPDFDLNRLVERNENFRYVDRISCEQIDEQGVAAFEKLVLLHVVIGGKPLIVDTYDQKLDPWTFTPKWLRDNVGEKIEQARNITAKEYLPLTIAHYLKNMGLLTNQYFENETNYKDRSRQRIYLKDIDCPQVWHDKLQEQIPAGLFYLNENTGDHGGPGARVDATSNVPGRRLGRGIARAGDLMSSLPPEMRAENMMCYIGHEGTYTPAHREMCATLGHNIMVEASGEIGEDGKPEKPGSSIWFMTESKDRATVSEYWLSVLGHDIEVENHFSQISAWKRAPFTVYVAQQRPGDFIIIPPLAPHQVWNRGTRTMKVAWNRTTVETLEMAMNEALPKARIVCRDEQYKNKAIIYYTLIKYSGLLQSAKTQAERQPTQEASFALLNSSKIRQLYKDFKRLFALFKNIMLSEMFSPDERAEKCDFLPFDSNVTCAYCRGNIFNRFLSCPSCKDALGHSEEEPYDVCMDCYAMGRSCGCISNLKFHEQFKWKELTQKYEAWRKQIIEFEGGQTNTDTPLNLADERRRYPKKTLAEVCREQLKRRPFMDIKKSKEDQVDHEESEEEILVDDEGRVKKTVKKRSKTWLKNHTPCHVCCHRHPNWKMAKCTTCDRSWCYGSLFRGHDDMPFTVMEDLNWSCPHCQGVCFAGGCRKDPNQKPYEPKGTLLGHDTKKVADARSVECLVDFGVSNLNWIRDDEQATESARIRRAREEAQRAKAIDPTLQGDDRYADDGDHHHTFDDRVDESQVQFEYSPDANLDPALGGPGHSPHPYAASHPRVDFDETSLLEHLQRADGTLPPGFAPVANKGYPDPNADDQYQYPDPTEGREEDEEDDDHEPRTSRFKPFRKVHGKGDKGKGKRRHTEGEGEGDDEIFMNPKKERKALEEAKKQGRFVAVSAALKGKKKLVKLRVPGARLAQLLARQATQQAPPLASPVADQWRGWRRRNCFAPLGYSYRQQEREAQEEAGQPQKVRVPVERDEDFSMRGDRRERNATKLKKRGYFSEYEEVDVATDEEDKAVDVAPPQTTYDANGKRRVSKYLQHKHQDDPELPDVLPDNHRDRDPRESRRKAAARRASPSGATGAENRPAMRPASGPAKNKPQFFDGALDDDYLDTDAISDDEALVDVDHDAAPLPFSAINAVSHVQNGHDNRLSPASTRLSAGPSTAEEENRLAKLQALKMVEDELELSSAEASPAPQPRAPVTNMMSGGKKSSILHKSIFDRGKKIKIVSAAAKRASTGAKSARAGASRDRDEDDSDTDTGDTIPARRVSRRSRAGRD
ncbi:hypothetical protein H2203_006088 [Taxawa tesnikishii (nom. ined.)]|nr:hypothetical protein H2203_006088 [Dothideales sp. JES 119]